MALSDNQWLKHLLLFSSLVSTCAGATDHYVIDAQHTFSSFEYLHWGLSMQRGRFDKNSGTIDLDLDGKSGNVLLEIDATSVSTGSEVFNQAMRSSSFFDAEQFPKIVFTSSRLVFEKDQLSQIEGHLQIRDVTRPVVLEVTRFDCRFMLLYMKKACGANGYTKILRSDFNIGRYIPFVSDEVTLYFSVEAIKEKTD